MAVDSLQKTAETAAAAEEEAAPKQRGRPFCKGQSGNPKGRPKGSVNRSTRAAVLLLDGAAEALTQKAIDLALAGDATALRLCLDRVVGARRGRPVELAGDVAVPPITRPADLVTAMNAIATAATRGIITPDEAAALSQMVDTCSRTLEAGWRERVRLWRGRLFRIWADPKTRRIAFGID